jgi:DNA-binding MarR family transcriptional regulator
MKLDEFLECLKKVQQIHSEMPIQQLMCLLVIARKPEGLSLTEVAQMTNISLTTASRYIAALGKQNRKREEGLNFVESYEDPMERRKKIIRLSPRGRATINKLTGVKNDHL